MYNSDDLKFRYTFKHNGTGEFIYKFITLKEIEYGYGEEKLSIGQLIGNMKKNGYIFIARDVYTGLNDRKGKEIYTKDIVAFDKFIWYGVPLKDRKYYDNIEDYKFTITWDKNNAQWSYPGGSTNYEFHCEVIGNLHKNKEIKLYNQ